MATGILTRGDIISEGLELGGNPGLTVRARVFLNLFLDRYGRAKDHLELLIENTALATTVNSETVSLSSIGTLRKIAQVWLQDAAAGLQQTLRERIFVTLNSAREAGTKARPLKFVHDRQGDQLIFEVPADKIYTMRILYYDLPAQPSSTDTSTYDALSPTFPSSYLLVAAVALFAQRWNMDTMLALALRAVSEALDAEAAEREDMDQGANELRLELDPIVYRQYIPD